MAKHKKGGHHEEHMDESWLIPYADLLTLLLALFIVMFASSSTNEAKFNAMASVFQGLLNDFPSGLPEGVGEGMGGTFDAGSLQAIDLEQFVAAVSSQSADGEMPKNLGASEMAELQKTLKSYFEAAGISSRVATYIDERGLVVSLSDVILFTPGSAEVNPETVMTLTQIGNSVKNFDNYIRVEGHTDTVPINTLQYPSNWELSGARASSVIKIFISECGIKPERLVSVGYGEFKPVSDNETVEGRAKNRRVDIIVLDTKYNTLEDHFTSADDYETESADGTENQTGEGETEAEAGAGTDAESSGELQEPKEAAEE